MNLGKLITNPDDRIAIIETTTGKEYSYQELETLSNSLASQIVVRNTPIGLVGENSAKWFVCYLAILKSGSIVVPISHKLPKAAFDQILLDRNIETVFADRNLDDVDTILFDEIDNLEPVEFQAVDVDENATAIILHTSGSSGKPKAVEISHGNHYWILEHKNKGKDRKKFRTLVSAPCYHMHGLSVLEISIVGQGTAVVMPVFSTTEFITNVDRHQINFLTAIPSMMASVVKDPLLKNVDTSKVRQIVLASAPTSAKLFQEVKLAFPNAKIVLTYGLTEVGPGIFGYHPEGIETPDGSVGYPLPGVEYRLSNEILEIKSPSMMTRYSNVDNTRITEDGFFVTNDIFKIDDQGFYYCLGRADEMFVSGGHNIYPSNVEKILEKHPCVKEAAVVGIEDEIKGVKPYAFVITEDNSIDFKEYLLEHVEPFECPREIWLMDQFPVTDINKTDKKKLQEIARSKLVVNKEKITGFKRINSLEGRVAVITGGCGQIGFAAAHRLASLGVRVVSVVRRNLISAQEMMDTLPNSNLGHFAVLASVTNSTSLQAAAKEVKEKAGACDILINAAGITAGHVLNWNDITDETFDDVIITNLRGPYSTSKAFVSLLNQSDIAIVINISSAAANRPHRPDVAYSASKGGLNTLTQSLSKQLAPKIRVVGVAPTRLTTKMSNRPASPEESNQWAKRIPLAELASPNEVVDVIESLIITMRYVTGQTIIVDGGLSV